MPASIVSLRIENWLASQDTLAMAHDTNICLLQARQMSGKGQFPFMVDPNTGRQMLESDSIIEYLWSTYGDGQVRTGN